jgi:hypothetical protein
MDLFLTLFELSTCSIQGFSLLEFYIQQPWKHTKNREEKLAITNQNPFNLSPVILSGDKWLPLLER